MNISHIVHRLTFFVNPMYNQNIPQTENVLLLNQDATTDCILFELWLFFHEILSWLHSENQDLHIQMKIVKYANLSHYRKFPLANQEDLLLINFHQYTYSLT